MANTNKGRKLFVSVTVAAGAIPLAAPADLTEAEFAALLWTEVKNVGHIGETGTKTNIVKYDELSTDVTQKQKGISDAGDPEVECSRNGGDSGQSALRAAGLDKRYYAFKIVDDDMPAAGTNATTYYMRGLVAGPVHPNGRNEDFIRETFTFGLVQREVIVEAA
jgi:hypothetical protein